MKEIEFSKQDKPMLVVVRYPRTASLEEIDAACSQARAVVDAMIARGVGIFILPDSFQVEIKSPNAERPDPAFCNHVKGPADFDIETKPVQPE